MRSRISSKLTFASCVGYFDRAHYGFYVTSSRMLVLVEGKKSDSCGTQWVYKYEVCAYGYVLRSMRPYLFWLDVILTAVVTAYLGWRKNGQRNSRTGGVPVDYHFSLWTLFVISFFFNVTCEMEDFVETHLCKLCGILRSRVLRVLCDLIKDVSPY